MHTPEQAKALWCPMARVANVGQVYNRVDTVYLGYKAGPDREYFERQKENCNCIADQCAMWRWATNGNYEHDCAVTGTDLGKTVTPSGYCGLAGKPGSTS